MFALCTVLLREYEELLNDNRELHNHIEHQVDVFRPDFSDHLLFDSCKKITYHKQPLNFCILGSHLSEVHFRRSVGRQYLVALVI